MRSILLLTLLWTMGLLSVVPAQDVIRLKRGGVMEGLVIEETDTSYLLQIGGGTIAVNRDLVAEVVRSDAPEDAERRTVLAALTRFRPRATHHFLYRDGRRVGFRMRSVKPDVSSEVPGYLVEDRLAFVDRPGGTPTVDIARREFVDAELRPRSYEVRVASGGRVRTLQGQFEEGGLLRIAERVGNDTHHRMTLVPRGVALPGALSLELAQEGAFEGPERRARVFDPRAERFQEVTVAREQTSRVHRGEERAVRVLRQVTAAGEATETWADRDGVVLREEIGSTGLVSLRAPTREVVGWIRGDDTEVGPDDLGLELVFEANGLALRRPDRSWEVIDGARAGRRVVTLGQPRDRATIDVFKLPVRTGKPLAEEVALKLIGRMAQRAERHELKEILPTEIAGERGIRFRSRGRIDGKEVVTTGFVFGLGDRWFALLAAAPRGLHDKSIGDVEKVVHSIELLRGADAFEDPFQTVEELTREEAPDGGEGEGR